MLVIVWVIISMTRKCIDIWSGNLPLITACSMDVNGNASYGYLHISTIYSLIRWKSKYPAL